MRTNLPNIIARSKLRVASATTVTLKWVNVSGGSVDPLTGERVGSISAPQTATATALVHFVGPVTSGYRVHGEIQIGDAILDFDPEVAIDSKAGLIFEFGDAQWVQAEVGETLSKSWDTMFGDQKLFRTVLVRRRT